MSFFSKIKVWISGVAYFPKPNFQCTKPTLLSLILTPPMSLNLKKTTPINRELIPEACDPTKNKPRIWGGRWTWFSTFKLNLTDRKYSNFIKSKPSSIQVIYVLDHAIFDQDRELNLKRQKILPFKPPSMSLILTNLSPKGYVSGEIYMPYISLELFYLQIVFP